jgi:syntaxin 5
MDRTAEFFTVVDVLRQHAGVAPSPFAALTAARPLPPSAPHRASRALGRRVRAAPRRVGRLGALAAHKGMFDDPAAEIAELTATLKAELAALDAAVSAFAADAGVAPAPAGAVAGATGAPAHWAAVTDTLRGHVLDATRGFQDALRVRSENLRAQADRRRGLGGVAGGARWAPAAAALPLDAPLFAATTAAGAGAGAAAGAGAVGAGGGGGGGGGGAAGRRPPRAPARPGTGPGAGPDGGLRRRGAGPPPLAGGHGPGPPTATATPPPGFDPPRVPRAPAAPSFSAAALATVQGARAREADARAVEAAVVEIGAMFTHMAAVVAEQGDVLARIDADVDVAAANVEAARGELSALLARVSAARGFIVRLLALAAFVIVLFAVFRPPS